MNKNIVIVALAILLVLMASVAFSVIFFLMPAEEKIGDAIEEGKKNISVILKKDQTVYTGVAIPDKALTSDKELNISMAKTYLSPRHAELRKFERIEKLAGYSIFIFSSPVIEEAPERLASN